MSNKVDKARGIIERLFGGITAEPGFSRKISDDDVLRQINDTGFIWDDERQTWIDKPIQDAIDAGLSPNEIWGNS